MTSANYWGEHYSNSWSQTPFSEEYVLEDDEENRCRHVDFKSWVSALDLDSFEKFFLNICPLAKSVEYGVVDTLMLFYKVPIAYLLLLTQLYGEANVVTRTKSNGIEMVGYIDRSRLATLVYYETQHQRHRLMWEVHWTGSRNNANYPMENRGSWSQRWRTIMNAAWAVAVQFFQHGVDTSTSIWRRKHGQTYKIQWTQMVWIYC